MRHAVIVTAAGSSRRFNGPENASKKEFVHIEGESVLCRAIRPFLASEGLCALVVTYRKEDLQTTQKLVETLDTTGVRVLYVEGGATRQESVFNGLKALYDLRDALDIQLVSIHDGARPFVDTALVDRCLEAAARTGGACPCLPVTDTIVKVSEDGLLQSRIDRDGVFTVQTPQTFRFPDIYLAHCRARSDVAYTDDTEIFLHWGGSVACIEGSTGNRKITFAKDIPDRRHS